MNGVCVERGRQGGFALIFSLIMLVLMTLLAVSAFHLGATQTVVVANVQHRNESVDAAQRAIDTVLSSGQWAGFATDGSVTPAMMLPNGCGSPCQVGADVNGDGTNDVTVTLTAPQCVWAATPKNLDINKDSDLGCTEQQDNLSFGQDDPNGLTRKILCADTDWEVQATTQDSITSTAVTVVQGFSLRMDSALALPRCGVQM